MKLEVLVNAKIGNSSVWGEPTGLAARAYGIAVCIEPRNWVRFTPVRFV